MRHQESDLEGQLMLALLIVGIVGILFLLSGMLESWQPSVQIMQPMQPVMVEEPTTITLSAGEFTGNVIIKRVSAIIPGRLK